jgi:hypothetical protein
MTDTTVRPAEVAGGPPVHPLEPATGAEYLAGRQILAGACSATASGSPTSGWRSPPRTRCGPGRPAGGCGRS